MILEHECPFCLSIGLKPLPVDGTLEEVIPDCYFCVTCGRHHINKVLGKDIA